MKEQKYAFVLDSEGNILKPTKEEKAWFKVRKGKAKVIKRNPLVIQLNYEVDNIDTNEVSMGLDVGQTTGVSLVEECKTKNKVLFLAEINHRKDVSKLVTQRAGYRRLRRAEKRYRPARFNNRGNSKRKGRIPPSIKARQDEIVRTVKFLQKFITFNKIVVEDVAFDIRALTDGYKPYRWEYQKSNRLDNNLRVATLIRDNFTCQLCEAKEKKLEAHHITPRRMNGEDTIRNLITLCSECHKKVTGREEEYTETFYKITRGKQTGLRYASHVMQGKTYLYQELSKLVEVVEKTDGGMTANRRADWGIDKSHVKDAVVITGLRPSFINTYEYVIKPMRKKRKCKVEKEREIVQGDRVYYTPRGKKKVECYVNAILSNGKMKGYYKLVGIKIGERYGPVSIKSITKLGTEKGLRII